MKKQTPFEFVSPMSELERKFIILSRISVALHRKGFSATVGILNDFAHINVQDKNHDTVEHMLTTDLTESQLLDWWSKLENDVE